MKSDIEKKITALMEELAKEGILCTLFVDPIPDSETKKNNKIKRIEKSLWTTAPTLVQAAYGISTACVSHETIYTALCLANANNKQVLIENTLLDFEKD